MYVKIDVVDVEEWYRLRNGKLIACEIPPVGTPCFWIIGVRADETELLAGYTDDSGEGEVTEVYSWQSTCWLRQDYGYTYPKEEMIELLCSMDRDLLSLILLDIRTYLHCRKPGVSFGHLRRTMKSRIESARPLA